MNLPLTFKEYAKDNGWLFKLKQTFDNSDNITDAKTGLYRKTLSCTLSHFRYNTFPYMDTFKFFNGYTGLLQSDHSNMRNYRKLDETEGNDDMVDDDMVDWDQLSDEEKFKIVNRPDDTEVGDDSCQHCNGMGHDDMTGEECEWCMGTGVEHMEDYMEDYMEDEDDMYGPGDDELKAGEEILSDEDDDETEMGNYPGMEEALAKWPLRRNFTTLTPWTTVLRSS